jgi:nucleotide-binding universal stress UspA family protein
MSKPPILVCTDFSAIARHAAERAALLARELGAPLVLLHVLPGDALEALRGWFGASDAPATRVTEDARHRLETLAGELRAAHGVEVAASLGSGSVLDEILAEAERGDARLIVVGAQGEGVLRRLLLGTTAERLVRRTPRPVLIVREAPRAGYSTALVAVDFSPSSVGTLAAARAVAPQARPILLTTFEVPFADKLQIAGVDDATIAGYRQQAEAEAAERLAAFATAAGLGANDWQPLVMEGDAALRIVEQEQAQAADLVVLGKHGKSAREELLLGSVTRHVLGEAARDVLITVAKRG